MNPIYTGKMIARLRKESGLTQAELAEKLNVSDKAVSKWERGISCPDVSLWNALSIILNSDIESLIYGIYGTDFSRKWRGILFLDDSVPADLIIYNRPLIDYLLAQFLLAGIKDITVIGKCSRVSFPGVSIQFLEHKGQLNQRFTDPLVVIFGNRFLYGPDLTRHFNRAMSRTDGITILSTLKRIGQYPIRVDADKRLVLSKTESINQYFAEPYLFVPESEIFRLYSHIGDFKDIIRLSGIYAKTFSRGMGVFEINSYENAFKFSEYVRLMEEITGEQIGCVEEILIRRGMANYETVIKDCCKETRLYLKSIFQDENM